MTRALGPLFTRRARPPPQLLSQQYPQASYLNGLAHMQSQTPYGPHLPSTSTTAPMHSVSGTVTNLLNIFTLSSGFEAATSKTPNKESTSYNAPNAAGVRGDVYPQSFSDQYNLLDTSIASNARLQP